MAAIPIGIAVVDLFAWAAAALGITYTAFKVSEAISTGQNRTSSSSRGGSGCPPHEYYGGKDLDYLARRLGMDRVALGRAIHREKRSIEGNPDVVFCLKCGGVFTKRGEHVGDL